jgi:hypothetical protein
MANKLITLLKISNLCLFFFYHLKAVAIVVKHTLFLTSRKKKHQDIFIVPLISQIGADICSFFCIHLRNLREIDILLNSLPLLPQVS